MQSATVHITKLAVNAGDQSQHIDWLAHMMMTGIESSAVLSAEILPPTATATNEWTLVQRFHDESALTIWGESPARKDLLKEIRAKEEAGYVRLTESLAAQYGTAGSVAAAIVTQVKSGQEAEYCKYAAEFQVAQSQHPGYRGAYLQPPTKGTAGSWTTLVRFDTPEALDRWFTSDQRRAIIAKSDPIVDSFDVQMMQTSFPGWFNVSDATKGPPNWKTAMLILLGLYPIIMISMHFVDPLFRNVPLPVEKFFGTIMTVSFTTWISMPPAIKAFRPWLFPTKSTPKWVGPVAMLILLCAFAAEITLISLLL